jgi:asparagine synthase (glutamine-hydrolysing)
VIEAAVAIPFEQVLAGDVSRLSTLKQDVVSAGVKATLGIEMPVNEKRRFQDGATATPRERVSKAWCRRTFNALWQDRQKEAESLQKRSGNETVSA